MLLAEAANLGSDSARIELLAREHLAKCPDCQEKIWQQILKLEEIDF